VVGYWHVLLVCTGTLSYCMGRVAYVVLLCDAGSSIQEEGDYADLAIGGSPVQGGGSLLQQGHTNKQTDRQMQVSATGSGRDAKGPPP
jgi:hypothetical protein